MAGSVIRDKGLAAGAKVVFCELAMWRNGYGEVRRGQRAIAEAVGLNKNTVGHYLTELEERGHVRLKPVGRGKRPSYILLSWVYRKRREQEQAA